MSLGGSGRGHPWRVIVTLNTYQNQKNRSLTPKTVRPGSFHYWNVLSVWAVDAAVAADAG